MSGKIFLILLVIFLGARLSRFYYKKHRRNDSGRAHHSLTPREKKEKSLQSQLWAVLVFTKLSTKRFFRDRLAQFFTVLFPLIFLFVFGSLNKNGGNVSFHVAVINQSSSSVSRSF